MFPGILLGFILICQMDKILGVPIEEISTANNDKISSNFSASSEEHYQQMTIMDHVAPVHEGENVSVIFEHKSQNVKEVFDEYEKNTNRPTTVTLIEKCIIDTPSKPTEMSKRKAMKLAKARATLRTSITTNNKSTTKNETEFPFTESSEIIIEKTTTRIIKPISDLVLSSQSMTTFYSFALPTFMGIIFCVGLVCIMLRPKGYCCRKIFARNATPLQTQEEVDDRPARPKIF